MPIFGIKERRKHRGCSQSCIYPLYSRGLKLSSFLLYNVCMGRSFWDTGWFFKFPYLDMKSGIWRNVPKLYMYCGVSGFSWSFTMGLGDEGNPKVILPTDVCLRTMAPETRDGKREPICFYRDPRPSYLSGWLRGCGLTCLAVLLRGVCECDVM